MSGSASGPALLVEQGTEWEVELPPLHVGQTEVAFHPARFKVLACGRRWGKTKLGALMCVVKAMQGKRAWWVAPSYHVANVGWRETKQLAKQIPGVYIRESDRIIEFPTGGTVQIRSASDPDSLRGEGLDLVVVDEFAFVKGGTWDEALRPALADRQGEAILISTPKGFNLFHDLFQLGQRDDFPDWKSWSFPSLSNPYINADEVALAKATQPPHVFEQEYNARFLEAGGRQVFQREWFTLALGTRYIHDDPAMSGRVIGRWISWDTALKDNDESAYSACVVFELLEDYRVIVREVWRDRVDFPTLVWAIEEFATRYDYDGLLRGVIIEDKASGTSAYQTLQYGTSAWMADVLIPFAPGQHDKEQRGHQAAVWCRNGCVLLPAPSEGLPWNLYDFEQEFFNFPAAPFADMADAFNQGVIYLEPRLAEGWQARLNPERAA